MSGDDPLSDLLRTLIRAGADPTTCREVLDRIRRRWVGECYIKAVDRETRDAEIKAGLAAGESARKTAEKVGTSQTTVRRVWRDW